MSPSVILFSYMAPPILNAESILVGKTLRRVQQDVNMTCISASGEMLYKKDAQMEAWVQDVAMKRFAAFPVQSVFLRKVWARGTSFWGEYGYEWWRWGVKRQLSSMMEGHSLIYSRSHPGVSHLAALDGKKRTGLPWVAQFSDPWAYNPYERRTRRAQKNTEYKEAAVVCHADHLIFPTEEIAALFAEKYPEDGVPQKTTVLPHGFEPDWYPEPDPLLVGQSRERLRLSYVGDFYGSRSPLPLIRAVCHLPQHLADRITIRIIGNVAGTLQPLFGQAGERRKLFELVGPVPYLYSLREMADSDALVVVDAPSAHSLFLPSKVIDYLGARRPILGITPTKGPTARLLGSLKQPVAAPDKETDVSDALRDFISNMDRYRYDIESADVSRFEMEHIAKQLKAVWTRLL